MNNQQPNSLRRRKRRRLPTDRYADLGAVCSVTIAVRERRRVFADPAIADATATIVHQRASATGVLVYAYCIMPDHVHLVLSPSPTCDLITFVGQFKNLVLRSAWRLGTQGSLWQHGFWDHFLRAEEDVETVVEYVLYNPVRAGLVEDRRDYPFAGTVQWGI